MLMHMQIHANKQRTVVFLLSLAKYAIFMLMKIKMPANKQHITDKYSCFPATLFLCS